MNITKMGSENKTIHHLSIPTIQYSNDMILNFQQVKRSSKDQSLIPKTNIVQKYLYEYSKYCFFQYPPLRCKM